MGSVFGPLRFLLPVCDLVGFYTHCSFFVTFFSATIDGRNLIFGHKLHIGSPYHGKRFWTHQIPTYCLSILLIFIHIEHTLYIRVITKLPNSEQSYKGKVKTHNYINRKNQW